MSQEILSKLVDAVVNGEKEATRKIVEEAVSKKIEIEKILNEGLIKAMDVVGEKFAKKEFFVLELVLAAEAMYAGLDVIKPYLASSKTKSPHKIVLGTVHGDIHTIGKDLVKMMLEGAGFEVIDLGADVPPEVFVENVVKHQPKIVGMSALISTARESMRKTIKKLVEAEVRDKIKIMVGGATVSKEFAKEIGADAYCVDAKEAVDKAREFVKG